MSEVLEKGEKMGELLSVMPRRLSIRKGRQKNDISWLAARDSSSYNKRQGYLAEFKNQKDALGRDTGSWTDWVPTVNSPDVEIIMRE